MNQKQDNLDDANNEIKGLKDENHRLKSAIVNKDSENQSLLKQATKEKEIREAESGKLERMLNSEQTRVITAVREAEQSSTKILMYERQTE